jgi:ribosomal protein L24
MTFAPGDRVVILRGSNKGKEGTYKLDVDKIPVVELDNKVILYGVDVNTIRKV